MPSLNQKQCSVEGCERVAEKRSYCGTHYTRWLKWGDASKPTRFDHPKHCSAEGCETIHYARGYCQKHHQEHFYNSHYIYTTWEGMKSRCDNPNAQNYARYGGRGIILCERWYKYENFLADMGEKPTPQHTLDRIDVNGNYEPSNCRWATTKEQAANKRKAKSCY